MISKAIHILGIFLIISFCAISILFTVTEREVEDESVRAFMSYPSYFENRFYDVRMLLTLDQEQKDERIVLAAIDDNSLTQIGRWPWTRTKWAEVIRKLNTYGAKIIAFDVFFSEPEVACNAESPDIDLAKAIEEFQATPGNRVILPYSLATSESEAFKEVPDQLYNFILDTKQLQGLNLQERAIGQKVYPIPTLADTDAGLGIIEAEEDPDGIFRHYPVLANAETLYFPSFSLLAYQLYTGDKPTLELLNPGEAKLKLKTGSLNLNQKGEARVRWLGGQAQFPEVTIFDLLKAGDNDTEMHNLLKGTIVMIGSTAFGAHDLRHTPIDPMLPGIYFHMNMANMLLDGKFFVSEAESTKYSWILLVLGTFLIILIQFFGNAILDLFAVAVIASSMFILDTYYLLPLGYEIKLFFCMFSAIACYSWTTFLHFYSANKDKKMIKGTFASFVAPAIVDQMLSDPDKVKVGGEKKNITVFFSDVRDFTSISEKLTPEELSLCLNQYMGVMTDILFKNYGTLDKYIGDAIVAFWGAPLEVENHAYWAVKSSIEMIEALPLINEKFKEQGFPNFEHGIGLNTGDCSVGNMGSDSIFQYTALGDNMNLGARLEALCKFYGVELNVSEYTINAIPEDLRAEFTYRILDKVRVKGKEDSVTIYEVFHPSHPFNLDRDALKDYLKAWDHYQAQEFQSAVDTLAPLTEKYPKDKSCARIKKQCEDFIEFPPPPDWDGVFTHTSKG